MNACASIGLVCVLLLGAANAQTETRAAPAGPDRIEEAKRELKRAIDRKLAQRVRELRRDLHAAVDEAFEKVGRQDLDGLLTELEGGGEVEDATPAAPASDPLDLRSTPLSAVTAADRAQYEKLSAGVAQLRELLGADNPRVLSAEESLRWHVAHPREQAGSLMGFVWTSKPTGRVLVKRGGLAARCGLLPGDRILAVGGTSLKNRDINWFTRLTERMEWRLRAGGELRLQVAPRQAGAPPREVVLKRMAIEAADDELDPRHVLERLSREQSRQLPSVQVVGPGSDRAPAPRRER